MMFKTSALLLAALLPGVLGQNVTFLTGLAEVLTSQGLTDLLTVVSQINGSSVGQYLLANISNGSPHVLFAPNNQAITNAPPNVTQDVGRLTDVFGYHIVPGNFSGTIPTYPNVTLGRTLLTDPSLVALEGGNKAQVVAWSLRGDGKSHVLNQRNDTSVVNVTTYGNITIYVIDQLLTPPENFSATISTNNQSLTSVEIIIQNVQVPYFNSSTNQTTNISFFNAINEQYHGFTLFAPNNSAIQNATSTLQGLIGNTTALQNVLLNHLINGTTLYSPLLADQNFTSASGESLAFHINATGQYVTSGNVTALIIQPDILLPNGVVHIIDQVLVNTESDTSAASSAIASATSAATASATETVPIGFSQTASLNPSPSASGGKTAANGSSSGAESVRAGSSGLVSIAVAFLSVVYGGLITLL